MAFTLDTVSKRAAAMNDSGHYAVIILVASAVGLVALMANRLTERIKVPVPMFVLAGSALASSLLPALPTAKLFIGRSRP